jgi:eukaryotic-like serine/threonine-protein kinase
MPCPDENTLIEFCERRLDHRLEVALRTHLDECDPCRRLVSDFLRTSSPELIGRDRFPPGSRMGRYIIEHKLGAGGMGVVYVARDAELSRQIAIKVWRPGVGETEAEKVQARLTREARAMARLAHPNVVVVFEVGAVDELVYVAMEYVEGQTLAAWSVAARRSWQEVIQIYLQAGAGLAAAHAAGIIHRDFKPANAILGTDGRVRVLDFGLARATDEAHEVEASLASTSAWVGDPHTRNSALIGTPAYMAPEQRLARPATALTDQYSFCVSLFEALFGARPGEPRSSSGAVVPAPPARIRRALETGLNAQPEQRWTSVDELLAELRAAAQTPARRRRAVLAASGAIATALITAVTVPALTDRQADAALCTGSENLLADVWNDDIRDRTSKAFGATGQRFAEDSYQRVRSALDAYVGSWTSMHREACLATRKIGQQSESMLDRRMLCLARLSAELEGLVAELVSADRAVVERSVSAVGSLTPIATCGDLSSLSAMPPAPAELTKRGRVEALRAKLARSRSTWRLGRAKDARALAEEAEKESRHLADPPVRAESLLQVGEQRFLSGAHQEAVHALIEAVAEAERAAHDVVRAKAAVQLFVVVGIGLGRTADAHHWRDVAAAMVERIGDRADTRLRLRLLNESGRLFSAEGKRKEALEFHQRAMALVERELGPDDPAIASTLLALALASDDPSDDKVQLMRRALGLVERTLGTEHPQVTYYWMGIGSAHAELGQYREALAAFERSLALYRATYGDEYPDVATALMNIGEVYLSLENPTAARRAFDQALPIVEKAYGPTDRDGGTILLGLARAELLGRGDVKRAVELAERGYAIHRQALGAEHPGLARDRTVVARVQAHFGRRAAALANHDAAVAHAERFAGRTDVELATALIGRGETRLLFGDRRASSDFEGALEILGNAPGPLRQQANRGLLRARRN